MTDLRASLHQALDSVLAHERKQERFCQIQRDFSVLEDRGSTAAQLLKRDMATLQAQATRAMAKKPADMPTDPDAFLAQWRAFVSNIRQLKQDQLAELDRREKHREEAKLKRKRRAGSQSSTAPLTSPVPLLPPPPVPLPAATRPPASARPALTWFCAATSADGPSRLEVLRVRVDYLASVSSYAFRLPARGSDDYTRLLCALDEVLCMYMSRILRAVAQTADARTRSSVGVPTAWQDFCRLNAERERELDRAQLAQAEQNRIAEEKLAATVVRAHEKQETLKRRKLKKSARVEGILPSEAKEEELKPDTPTLDIDKARAMLANQAVAAALGLGYQPGHFAKLARKPAASEGKATTPPSAVSSVSPEPPADSESVILLKPGDVVTAVGEVCSDSRRLLRLVQCIQDVHTLFRAPDGSFDDEARSKIRQFRIGVAKNLERRSGCHTGLDPR